MGESEDDLFLEKNNVFEITMLPFLLKKFGHTFNIYLINVTSSFSFIQYQIFKFSSFYITSINITRIDKV